MSENPKVRALSFPKPEVLAVGQDFGRKVSYSSDKYYANNYNKNNWYNNNYYCNNSNKDHYNNDNKYYYNNVNSNYYANNKTLSLPIY